MANDPYTRVFVYLYKREKRKRERKKERKNERERKFRKFSVIETWKTRHDVCNVIAIQRALLTENGAES